MRVLGLYRAAEAEIPLSVARRCNRAFQAYAAGVNAFLADAPRRAAARVSAAALHARAVARGRQPRLGQADGAAARRQLPRRIAARPAWRARFRRRTWPSSIPAYPKDAPTTLGRRCADLSPAWRSAGSTTRCRRAVGPHYASNNWVVDGSTVASGKPLLANDPHLDFAAPGLWYLARLKTPRHEIAGATAAGMPLVVIGHNDQIAWGFTTTDRRCRGPVRRETRSRRSRPLSDPRRQRAVRHAAGKDRGARRARRSTLTVRATRHGPVVSDVLPPGTADPGYVLALSATFLRRRIAAPRRCGMSTAPPTGRAFARHGGALSDRCKTPSTPTTAARSALSRPGLVPIRGKGEGWMPAPGWTGEYDWKGFIPFDELPQATNPPSGHFVSANNKIVPDSYPYFLSRDWDLPNRAERIEALLAATPVQNSGVERRDRGRHPLADGQGAGAADDRDRPADAASREAVAGCGAGIFTWTATGSAPLLFTAWLRQFSHAVLFGRFGEAVGRLLGSEAAGHGGGADPAPGLVRRPEAARDRDLRHPARAIAASGTRRAAPRLWRRHGDLAMGPGACRGVRQPGLQPASRCCATGRRVDSDPRRLRHGQSRAEPDPRRSAPVRAGASAPGCGSSPTWPRPRIRG